MEYYKPDQTDKQQPHEQDEIYVVISGSGFFVNGDKRYPFEAGQVLFVPAGEVHRFEDFTEDFATWVFFYGPKGGEKA
ncbi:MAG: cupin domain-containing protein [Gracilimonas sp.]|uniref:cupin domain-containing protein n=1 Tax=Gracilimonas TaxID=649462 RepID=UPI001B25BD9E|nr:cupin domain-containing protein [Gracilimonas sp.]MBO6585744.1 cupin domain-containing protein [Gracilimonas sp.]MBO6616741.1 cupin domain-containing protein [Gracilimonas sp.]